jgi:hypothetical protein
MAVRSGWECSDFAGVCRILRQDCESIKAIIVDGAFSSDCTLEHLMKAG